MACRARKKLEDEEADAQFSFSKIKFAEKLLKAKWLEASQTIRDQYTILVATNNVSAGKQSRDERQIRQINQSGWMGIGLPLVDTYIAIRVKGTGKWCSSTVADRFQLDNFSQYNFSKQAKPPNGTYYNTSCKCPPKPYTVTMLAMMQCHFTVL